MEDNEFQKVLDDLDNDSYDLDIEDNKNSVNNKKRKVFEIKSAFVNSNKTYKLYEPVSTEALSELIKIKTQKLQNVIDKSKAALTKKVESILIRQIPYDLRQMHKKYNRCFIKHPGFLYKTSHQYGELTLWVEPNVPYFFEQFSELSIINKYALYQKGNLDKLVGMYHDYTQKMLKLEARIAVQLDGLDRIVDLLDFDVEYYLLYMDIVAAIKVKKQNIKYEGEVLKQKN